MFYEPLPMILKQLSGESDDMRMQWRHGPRAGLEGRHRAIGDVIAWSYELCTDKQRLLFDRLSVFAPGYDVNPEDAGTGVSDVGAELEAIEVVCADNVPIDGCEDSQITAGADQVSAAISLTRNEVRELLDGLVEQSLVSINITADTVRYFLLESLRLFAADRLAERSTNQIDEPARLARRHYYRDKVIHAKDQPATMGASSSWQTLSEAEQEVAILAAAGWPNSAIGVRRGTSTKTAEAQISSILQKLMIKSRKHIHRFIPEEQRNRISAEHAHRPRQATRH
jgi:DNA-binding NarL/FixJ family response regulator